MNILAKYAVAATFATALTLGTISTAQAERAMGLGDPTSWSVAISTEYTTGIRPVSPVYLSAGDSWSGSVERNGDGEIKFYVPRRNGSLGARWLECDSSGVTINVAVDGSFVVTC
jgi:hypothetical protein